MRRRLWAIGLAGAVLLSAVLSGTSAAAPYPVSEDPVTATLSGLLHSPEDSPPGANAASCHSSGRDPVVLVHGTGVNQFANWQFLAPTLANNGFCVYSFTYGRTTYSGNSGGVGSMYRSADELDRFVDSVLARTGAAKVDLIGHSQGGAVQRIYVSEPDRAAKVDTLVGVAAANSGVPHVSGLTPLLDSLPPVRDLVVLKLCPACAELNDQRTYGPPTRSVRYVNITSLNDEFIIPQSVGFLDPAPNVINETVQDICPHSRVGHLGIVYDPAAADMVMRALDPTRSEPVRCGTGFPQ